MAIRIVLDTNVALSALLWRGNPYRILELVQRRNDIRLYTSPALAAELAEVLQRPSPSKRLAVIGMTARDVLTAYLGATELVEPTEVPPVVARDPDDDHVIAAAVAARATLLVSGDEDLISMGHYREISIVTAREAIDRLEATGPT